MGGLWTQQTRQIELSNATGTHGHEGCPTCLAHLRALHSTVCISLHICKCVIGNAACSLSGPPMEPLEGFPTHPSSDRQGDMWLVHSLTRQGLWQSHLQPDSCEMGDAQFIQLEACMRPTNAIVVSKRSAHEPGAQ